MSTRSQVYFRAFAFAKVRQKMSGACMGRGRESTRFPLAERAVRRHFESRLVDALLDFFIRSNSVRALSAITFTCLEEGGL